MKKIFKRCKLITAIMLSLVVFSVPVSAQGVGNEGIAPCFSNISSAYLTIDFDMDNVVYCGLSVNPYSHGSGVSGLMKLYNSAGTCLEIWPISDYERPIECEYTYQGVYGETYTVTFEGYAYSNNGTAPDRLELSVSDTCID